MTYKLAFPEATVKEEKVETASAEQMLIANLVSGKNPNGFNPWIATPSDQNRLVLVLDWVNEQRASIGLEPLAVLPLGRMGQVRHCVIARSFPAGSSAGGATVCIKYRTKYLRLPKTKQLVVPPYVRTFIGHFDAGTYPALIDVPTFR